MFFLCDILIAKGGIIIKNIADKLNLVIEYIESHLADEIEQDEIAKIACCSYYEVGRMFSLIADISISDYIRKRRLTLAGAELKNDNAPLYIFIHSSISGHLGCFLLLGVVNNAALNPGVQVSV